MLLNGKLLRFADPGSVVLPPIVGAPSSCTLLTLPPTSVTWLVVQRLNASRPTSPKTDDVLGLLPKAVVERR